MPTGYTAPVADGTITDLKTFAMRLARGMGALISMRDAPWCTPIPKTLEQDDYRARQIADLSAKLSALDAMTAEQTDAEAQKAVAQFEADLVAAHQRHSEVRGRYLAMIAEVEAWDGAPEGIKEFALSQLNESLSFDCREPFTFWGERPVADGASWLAHAKASVCKELDYQTKAKAEEDARHLERNAWLAQLHESLRALDGADGAEVQAHG